MVLLKYSLKRLIKKNVYIGSSSRRWNEYVKSFIYYQYKKQYYFDLVKIMLSLRLINFFLMNLIVLKGNAVFIDNRKMFSVFLKFLKFETDHEILKEGWVSGTFTNFKEFQINKIYKNLNNEMLKKMGFYKLMRLPDVVITFSNYYNENAIIETKALGIPIISIINSDSNSAGISLPLYGNDIDKKSVVLIGQFLKFSIKQGFIEEKSQFYFYLSKYCYLLFLKNLYVINKKKING